MKRRRSSTSITLVLISAAALTACEQRPQATQRDIYASQADCVQDWGANPAKCEAVAQKTTDGRHGYTHYYGPGYYGHNARPNTRAIGSTSSFSPGSASSSSTARSTSSSSSSGVSRSGFGSTASSRSSSSGGHSASSSS